MFICFSIYPQSNHPRHPGASKEVEHPVGAHSTFLNQRVLAGLGYIVHLHHWIADIYIYIYISLAVKTHVCKHYCGFSDCCCRTTAIRLSFCGLLREQKHQNEETSPQTSKPSARERRGVNIASAKNPRLLQGSDGSSCGGSNDGSDAAIAAAITATTAAAAAAAMRVVIATTMTTSTATVAKTATTSATKTHKTSAARKASASEGKDASARATAAAAINHAAHSLLNVKRYQSSCGTK